MNRLRTILAAGAGLAVLASAAPSLAHPDHADKQEVRKIEIIKSTSNDKEISRSEFVADCGKGRKFESSASSGEGTKAKKLSKMVICSDPGESDEAWAKTLRDALAKLEASDDMPSEGKASIIADLRNEIAKLGK